MNIRGQALSMNCKISNLFNYTPEEDDVQLSFQKEKWDLRILQTPKNRESDLLYFTISFGFKENSIGP